MRQKLKQFIYVAKCKGTTNLLAKGEQYVIAHSRNTRTGIPTSHRYTCPQRSDKANGSPRLRLHLVLMLHPSTGGSMDKTEAMLLFAHDVIVLNQV